MKHKLILLLSALLVINTVYAQWHFTANINYNCSSVYTSQIHLAEQFSATSFSTKQECESARQSVTMSFSAGNCYLRITTTPCSGSDIGGGGIGIGGISAGEIAVGGNSQGIVSPHSSIAIGEPYFAPNETQVISNTGQDLEIKLEAMNRSFNSAVNGIKTGDQAFDDIYRTQANALPKTKNENNWNYYTINSRSEIDFEKPVYVNNANNIETVNLGIDNEYFYDDNAIIVPIDPERINNQERDERWEKIKKEYFSDTERKDSKNKLFENNLVPLDVTESTTVYSAFTAPGLDVEDWENTNYSGSGSISGNVRKFLEKGGVDKEMIEGDAVSFIKGEVIDPIKDKTIGVASAFTGTGRLLNNVFDFKGTITTIAVDNAFGGFTKMTDNTIKAYFQGGDPTSGNIQTYQHVEQKSLYNVADYIYEHQ